MCNVCAQICVCAICCLFKEIDWKRNQARSAIQVAFCSFSVSHSRNLVAGIFVMQMIDQFLIKIALYRYWIPVPLVTSQSNNLLLQIFISVLSTLEEDTEWNFGIIIFLNFYFIYIISSSFVPFPLVLLFLLNFSLYRASPFNYFLQTLLFIYIFFLRMPSLIFCFCNSVCVC